VGPEFSKVSQDEDAGSLSSLAEITAEAPEVNPTLVAQMDASEGLVKQFYDLALSLGATEVWEGESGSPSSARLGPELAAVFVGVAISVRILAATLQRWIQGRNPGVTIEVEDGRVLVRVDKNLPQGMIVIHDPHDEIKVHNLALPPDTADDVAKVLRAIIQGGGGAGDTLN
jgi:hypothetical protein